MAQSDTTARQYLHRRVPFFCMESFFLIFSIEGIVKSGAISGWTDKDQFQIWWFHFSSTNNHLHYLSILQSDHC